MKGAHADLSGTAWQEIGVKPLFGLEWDTTNLDLSGTAWQEIGVKPFFGLSGIPRTLTLSL
jgi:hypothetical protein